MFIVSTGTFISFISCVTSKATSYKFLVSRALALNKKTHACFMVYYFKKNINMPK